MVDLPDFPETAWRGVFKWWREIVEPITVCPVPYHFANLLTILSAQMGDLAVLDEGVDTFLNFYIFNYGRTGTKKSTAMDLANQHIVKKLNPTYFKPLTSVSSAEGLIRVLATPPNNVTLHCDEVKDLFSVASRTGSRIEPVLNKAFGLGDVGTVVRSAADSLSGVNYFFNLIVNGTPVHISLDVGEALFHGGLLNRFLVFAAVPNDRTMPRMGVPDRDRIADFCQRLDLHVSAWRGFATTRGAVRVDLSEEALELYTPWYEQTERMTKTENEMVADPIQRVSLYAKKIAAMYCLWETPVPDAAPMVTVEQMQAAIDVARYCQASIVYMSSAWSGARSLGARGEALAETRIEVYLKEHGCISERLLSKHLHMSIGETKKAVTALASVNQVNVGLDRPATIHWTEKCMCFSAPVLGSAPVPTPVVTTAFEENPMYAEED